MNSRMKDYQVQPIPHNNEDQVPDAMFLAIKKAPADCFNSCQRRAPLLTPCDDALHVDQRHINIVSPSASSRPCVSILAPGSVNCHSNSACPSSASREKALARKIEFVSRMERTRKKLLQTMERSIKSRSVIKGRRLLSPFYYNYIRELRAEAICQCVHRAMQERISLSRRSSH